MKNSVVLALFLLALNGTSQTGKTWAFGLQLGLQGNNSSLSGGSDLAHGSFEHNSFGSGSFGGTVRYDHNARWMFMSGFGLFSYGFDYSRKVDYYTLKNVDDTRYSVIRNEFGAIEIPLMAFYKFRLNCRNARWILGAGFAKLLTGQQQSEETLFQNTEGRKDLHDYFRTEATAKGGAFTMFRVAFGRERTLKKGGLIQAALWINWGFNTIAQSTVHYEVDGQSFSHSFSNSGNFVGVRVAYYFRNGQNN